MVLVDRFCLHISHVPEKRKKIDKTKCLPSHFENDCKDAIGTSFMNLYCILNKFKPNLLAKFYFLAE